MTSPARIKTNHLLAKAFDLNDFLDPTRLAHDELQYYNDLTRLFDKTISKYIDWLDTPEARKLFYEQIKAKEEYFEAIDKDIDDIIQDTSLSADRIIEKIYNKGLQYGYKDINRLPVFNDACKYGLKATQEYNFELIQSVTDDLKESIKHHIFRGVAEGQSVHEVARAITDSGLEPLEGKTLTAYQRASLIARTEIARSMSTGRLQAYANYGVEKVKILTAGDDNVCPICRNAKKNIYTLEQASNLVPFHPACRCSVIAHTEHEKISEKPIKNPSSIDCCDSAQTKLANFNNRNEDDTVEYDFLDKELSQKIANEFGLTYESDGTKELFKGKNGLVFSFDKDFLEFLNKQKYVYYTKRDLIATYMDAPDMFKNSVKTLEFTLINNSDDPEAIAYYNHKNRTIYVLPDSIMIHPLDPSNFYFTFYHEFSHAFDHFNAEDEGYGLSPTHSKHMAKDSDYQKEELGLGNPVYPSAHAMDGAHEDFADSLAMVAIANHIGIKYAKIMLSNGDIVSFKEWLKLFPNRYQYCKNLFDFS